MSWNEPYFDDEIPLKYAIMNKYDQFNFHLDLCT